MTDDGVWTERKLESSRYEADRLKREIETVLCQYGLFTRPNIFHSVSGEFLL